MAIAVTFTDVWSDGRRLNAIGTLTFSGNYAAGGDSIDIKGTAPQAGGLRWFSSKDPSWVEVAGKAGYFFEYDAANKKLKVRQQINPANAGGADIPLTELAAAAYPGALIGDVVTFFAVGKKLI